MPEITHNFTGGKMNKDLDERLVPNGQYRDALNVQVLTSEGSDVGAVENILGNMLMPNQEFISDSAICVGSTTDEKDDAVYWFVKDVNADLIVQYKANRQLLPVVVDTNLNVLKFDPYKKVNNINIIDDLLYWTDGVNEPKKININTCIEGTDPSGVVHTDFKNLKTGTSVPLEEKHITVIKESPYFPPALELQARTTPASGKIVTGLMTVTDAPVPPTVKYADNLQNQESSLWTVDNSGYNHYFNFDTFVIGSKFDTRIDTDINNNSGFVLDWKEGDVILFKELEGSNFNTIPEIPLREYSLKAKIISWNYGNKFNDDQDLLTENFNFNTPDSNGTKPLYWDFDDANISYNNTQGFIDINGAGIVGQGAPGIAGSVQIDFKENKTYNFKIVISNSSGTGRILPYIIGDDGGVNFANITTGGNIPYWFKGGSAGASYLVADGTYEFSITTDQDNSADSHNYGNTSLDVLGNNTGGVSLAGKILLRVDVDDNDDPFTGRIEEITVREADTDNARVRLEVLDIKEPLSPGELGLERLTFVADKETSSEKLFKLKFPRFAYRYKYQDREYSTISPFSEIGFLPGNFDYHPVEGYNLGMVNRAINIKISGFMDNIPNGVVSVDLLYKDDSANSIYIVDTIKKDTLVSNENPWQNNYYTVTSEQINSIIPSNQSLRVWDAVPKTAFTQSISGNRLIYANYKQGYDLKNNNNEYYPAFNFNIISNNNDSYLTTKSIKTLREYQLGIVFVDKYGRETPVLSNKTGVEKLQKIQSDKENKLKISFTNNKYPDGMDYFKFFIKETSGEYYNMAMDRFYRDTEDNQVWLSFPSSDRNKLDIESFIILKKGIDSNDAVVEEARYKVLDIKNEAPDFIKQNKLLIEEITHNTANVSTDIFGSGIDDAPLTGKDNFKLKYGPFEGSTGGNLEESDGVLYIEFTNALNDISERYRIAEITKSTSPDYYNIKLDEQMGDDVNFISDDNSGLSPSQIKNGTIVNIYKYVEENLSRFEGRFFVKINIDSVFNETIQAPSSVSTKKYRTVRRKKLYNLPSDIVSKNSSGLTGQYHGCYSDGVSGAASSNSGIYGAYGGDTSAASNAGQTAFGIAGGFGRFAPFFRNYDQPETAHNYYNQTTSNNYVGANDGQINVGQYRFGKHESNSPIETYDRPWLVELTWITTWNTFRRSWNEGNDRDLENHFEKMKSADRYSSPGNNTDNASNRYGDFDANGNQTNGDVWFIDTAPYVATNPNDQLDWNDMNPVGDPSINGDGIFVSNGFIRMDIGMGGIYHPFVVNNPTLAPAQQQLYIDDFFKIGDGGNSDYDGSEISSLVRKIYSGQSFRFKEDPTGEIYTILGSVPLSRRIRWKYYTGSTPGFGQSPEVIDGTSNNYDTEANWREFSAQLSPNFTKNWQPKFLNSSGNATINWNPIDSNLGPISNGLELKINHSSSAGTPDSANNEVFIIVDSLQATDNVTGETHSITTGMILTSHSDGGSTLDGTAGKEFLAIYKIDGNGPYNLHLTGYSKMMFASDDLPLTGDVKHEIFTDMPDVNEEMIFKQPVMNGYSQYAVNRLNAQHRGSANSVGIMAIGYNIEFVEPIEEPDALPDNPAIWETEPKQTTELDIYYEASGSHTTVLKEENKYISIPLGSLVTHEQNPNSIINGTTVTDVVLYDGAQMPTASSLQVEPSGFVGTTTNWYIEVEAPSQNNNDLPFVGGEFIAIGDDLNIQKKDGTIMSVTVTGWIQENSNTISRASKIFINKALYGSQTSYTLPWSNCYSFGNGVESNRVRDSFNLPFISNGAKVSTTFDEGLGEEHRKNGLIYSGIYNSSGSVNELNQFIAAEKITKDINPTYGTIQKIHTRDSDLLTLCEDKCLRILVDKDAIFNADGNPQLLATRGVLGQVIPFTGEYGISRNPESFVSESYRSYFTDKIRGTVMRLSMDGLTPISMHGMRDYFKDNLITSRQLIGTYDYKKEEYNLTLKTEQVIVKGTNHNIDGDNGRYFFFDVSSMAVILNTQNWQSPSTVSIIQYRDGVQIFTGDVKIWGEYNANSLASPSGGLGRGHGRREPASTSGIPHFQIGDIITTAEHELRGLKDQTVSFSEENKGWVSFKSFILEHGCSVGSDYYTFNKGKIYKHNEESVDRNNFYNTQYNSSINVLINEQPGIVKSYKTISYDGSQSRIEGFKSIEVVNVVWGGSGSQDDGEYVLDFDSVLFGKIVGDDNWSSGSVFEVRVYRNNVLNYEGPIKAFKTGSYNGTHLRKDPDANEDDFLVGDIITTKAQQDVVKYTDYNAKDGWYVDSINTNKQTGSLNEFVEKEGKWFNYIKGIENNDISTIDFAASNVQGLGTITNITGDFIDFDDNVNTSVSIGDSVYFNTLTSQGVSNNDQLQTNNLTFAGKVVFVDSDTIELDSLSSGAQVGDYCMFVKNGVASVSSLVGYFADVKFENNSKEKIELFSISSDISLSSN